MPEPVSPSAPSAPSAPKPAPVGHAAGVVAHEAAPALAGGATEQRPTGTPEPAYLLMVHPDRWTVIEGQVVPQAAKLVISDGANLIEVTRDGKIVPSSLQHAIAQQRSKGFVVIPWDVDGPGRSYIRRVAGGGWISRWETLYPNSTERTTDSKGYAAWLRALIERGQIPAPPQYALHALESELVKRLERLLARPHVDPNSASIRSARASLAAVQSELRRLYDQAVPLPTEDESAPVIAPEV